jgi:hypothetical protein
MPTTPIVMKTTKPHVVLVSSDPTPPIAAHPQAAGL